MNYLQLDNFNGAINIICKDDGSGESLVFETLQNAEATLAENCQDGMVIPLTDSIDLFKRVNGLFNSGKILIEEETTEDKNNFNQLKKDIKNLLSK